MSTKAKNLEKVREIAMTFPGAWEDHPWGETVFKVGKKVFVFAGTEGAGITIKPLAEERDALLADDRFSVPHYVGKYGWLSLTFGKKVDWTEVRELIDTTYRQVATKTMVKQLDAQSG